MPDQNTQILMGDILKGGIGITGAVQQSDALNLQNKYEQSVFQFNSQMASSKAKEALAEGAVAAGLEEDRTGEQVGRAAAVSSGSGMVGSSGSALIAQEQTGSIGAHSALMDRLNSQREALGFETQATENQNQAQLSQDENQYRRRATIWSGAEGALGDVSKGFENLMPTVSPAKTDGGTITWDNIQIPDNQFSIGLSGNPISLNTPDWAKQQSASALMTPTGSFNPAPYTPNPDYQPG